MQISLLLNNLVGYDGTLIWDLQKYKRVEVPIITADMMRGQVSCLRWITGRFDARDTLCIGTSEGYLMIWQMKSETVRTSAFYTNERLMNTASNHLKNSTQAEFVQMS
jgi:hypothetical protein